MTYDVIQNGAENVDGRRIKSQNRSPLKPQDTQGQELRPPSSNAKSTQRSFWDTWEAPHASPSSLWKLPINKTYKNLTKMQKRTAGRAEVILGITHFISVRLRHCTTFPSSFPATFIWSHNSLLSNYTDWKRVQMFAKVFGCQVAFGKIWIFCAGTLHSFRCGTGWTNVWHFGRTEIKDRSFKALANEPCEPVQRATTTSASQICIFENEKTVLLHVHFSFCTFHNSTVLLLATTSNFCSCWDDVNKFSFIHKPI